MFDIGFWEIVLISVLGLVVLGPERLPVAIRSIVRFIQSIKSMTNNIKDELSQELKVQEMQEELERVKKMSEKSLAPELKQSLEELKQAASLRQNNATLSEQELSELELSEMEELTEMEEITEMEDIAEVDSEAETLSEYKTMEATINSTKSKAQETNS